MDDDFLIDDNNNLIRFCCTCKQISTISSVASIINIADDGVKVLMLDGKTMKITRNYFIDYFEETINTVQFNVKQMRRYPNIAIFIESLHLIQQMGGSIDPIESYKIVDNANFPIIITTTRGEVEEFTISAGDNLLISKSGKCYKLFNYRNIEPNSKPLIFATEKTYYKFHYVYVNGIEKLRKVYPGPPPTAVYRLGPMYIVKHLNRLHIDYSAHEPEQVYLYRFFLHDDLKMICKWFSHRVFFILPIHDVIKFKCSEKYLKCWTENDGIKKFPIRDFLGDKNTYDKKKALGLSRCKIFVVDNKNLLYCGEPFHKIKGKYYDRHLDKIYPIMQVDLPNCEICVIEKISTYNQDTFVFNDGFTILSQFATQIKNVTFSDSMVFSLLIELDSGEFKKAAIMGKKDINRIMFEDGSSFKLIPTDGNFYCKYGKYIEITSYAIISNHALLINGNRILFRRLSFSFYAFSGKFKVYECGGNYIAVDDSVYFGEITISRTQKHTKPAC